MTSSFLRESGSLLGDTASNNSLMSQLLLIQASIRVPAHQRRVIKSSKSASKTMVISKDLKLSALSCSTSAVTMVNKALTVSRAILCTSKLISTSSLTRNLRSPWPTARWSILCCFRMQHNSSHSVRSTSLSYFNTSKWSNHASVTSWSRFWNFMPVLWNSQRRHGWDSIMTKMEP